MQPSYIFACNGPTYFLRLTHRPLIGGIEIKCHPYKYSFILEFGFGAYWLAARPQFLAEERLPHPRSWDSSGWWPAVRMRLYSDKTAQGASDHSVATCIRMNSIGPSVRVPARKASKSVDLILG